MKMTNDDGYNFAAERSSLSHVDVGLQTRLTRVGIAVVIIHFDDFDSIMDYMCVSMSAYRSCQSLILYIYYEIVLRRYKET